LYRGQIVWGDYCNDGILVGGIFDGGDLVWRGIVRVAVTGGEMSGGDLT